MGYVSSELGLLCTQPCVEEFMLCHEGESDVNILYLIAIRLFGYPFPSVFALS